LRKLVQQWAPCNVSIVFGNTDPDYNPLVVRGEVVRMLQTIVLHMPQSERLVAELARWILTADTVGKELKTLTSTSTRKGSSNARRLAAEILCAIAALGVELIDQEMMVGARLIAVCCMLFVHMSMCPYVHNSLF
jgi:hypothetical protein